MNNQPHPIEFFLACLINLFQFVCYVINEIAGNHKQPATTTAKALISHPAPTSPAIQPLFTDLASLTKRQLQTLTGLRSSRYNKLQLQAIAADY